MARAQNWIFVLNNYTREDVQKLKFREEDEDSFSFVCWGNEVAPTIGTRHL